MGVIVESAITPTVIIQSLQEEEERPRVAKAHDYLCF